MVKGLNLKGILGLGLITTLALLGYFILAYLYFLLCNTFNLNAGYKISEHMPAIWPMFLSFFMFTFIIMAAEITNPVRAEADINLRAAGWVWVSLVIVLTCLPVLLNKTMLPRYSEIKNNLLFFILQYESRIFSVEHAHFVYKIILGGLLFASVVFSIFTGKALYRTKIDASEGGSEKGENMSIAAALVASLFSIFVLSIYLIISHSSNHTIARLRLNDTNLNYLVQMYLYFFLMVGLVVFTSKKYAKYVFTPWLTGLIAEGKHTLLFVIAMVLYVGFWLLVFSRFLECLSSYNLEEPISKMFFQSLVSVLKDIVGAITGLFEYADELGRLFQYLAVLVGDGLLWIVKKGLSLAKGNFEVVLVLLVAAALILNMKFIAKLGPPIKDTTSTLVQGMGGFAKKGLAVVGALTVAYLLFITMKLIYRGEFPLQVVFNWKVKPKDIHQVAIECEDGSNIYVLDNDARTGAHSKCRFHFPSDEDKCNWEAVVALENFVGSGDDQDVLDLHRQRGVHVMNQFLVEYRKLCKNKDRRPKLFVLNVGKPKKSGSLQSQDLGAEVFLTRANTSQAHLKKLLQSQVSAGEFQYWKLIDVTQDIY